MRLGLARLASSTQGPPPKGGPCHFVTPSAGRSTARVDPPRSRARSPRAFSARSNRCTGSTLLVIPRSPPYRLRSQSWRQGRAHHLSSKGGLHAAARSHHTATPPWVKSEATPATRRPSSALRKACGPLIPLKARLNGLNPNSISVADLRIGGGTADVGASLVAFVLAIGSLRREGAEQDPGPDSRVCISSRRHGAQ